jgi:hypothetical protein
MRARHEVSVVACSRRLQDFLHASGTNVPSPAGIDAVTCFADPGREIWLRVTYRPFGAHGS